MQQCDEGATLLLALVFITVVSLLGIALVQMAGNNLTATVQFKSAQSNQSSANSVTDLAIYQSRYIFSTNLVNATSPQPCWGTSPSTPSQLSINSTVVAAWCVMNYNPTSNNTRIVTIYSCVLSVASTGSACALRPLTTAVVTFDDVPSNPFGAANCIPGSNAFTTSTSTCGASMMLNSWVDRPLAA